eukprot:728138-Prymnesium_polylepis.1
MRGRRLKVWAQQHKCRHAVANELVRAPQPPSDADSGRPPPSSRAPPHLRRPPAPRVRVEHMQVAELERAGGAARHVADASDDKEEAVNEGAGVAAARARRVA